MYKFGRKIHLPAYAASSLALSAGVLFTDVQISGHIKRHVYKYINISENVGVSNDVIWAVVVLFLSFFGVFLIFQVIYLINVLFMPPVLTDEIKDTIVKNINFNTPISKPSILESKPTKKYYNALATYEIGIIDQFLRQLERELYGSKSVKGKVFCAAIYLLDDPSKLDKLKSFRNGTNKIINFKTTEFKIYDIGNDDGHGKGYAAACAARRESVMGSPKAFFSKDKKIFRDDSIAELRNKSFFCLPLYLAHNNQSHSGMFVGVLSIDSDNYRDFKEIWCSNKRKAKFTEDFTPYVSKLEVHISACYSLRQFI